MELLVAYLLLGIIVSFSTKVVRDDIWGIIGVTLVWPIFCVLLLSFFFITKLLKT